VNAGCMEEYENESRSAKEEVDGRENKMQGIKKSRSRYEPPARDCRSGSMFLLAPDSTFVKPSNQVGGNEVHIHFRNVA
jgi:hypothetical protein